MAAAVNAAFAAASTDSTIIAGFNRTTRKWRFESDGAGGVTALTLTPNAEAQRYFGLDAVNVGLQGPATIISPNTGYFFMTAAHDGSRNKPPEELPEDLAVALLGSDGSVEGIAQDGAVQVFEVILPLEPAAKVWHASRVTTDPWTWQLAFAHARNIEPILVVDTADTFVNWVGKLREDGCAFKPGLQSSGYRARADITLAAYFLGTPP
jgi:hypothetical protein